MKRKKFKNKLIIFIIIAILLFSIIVFCDYKNVITNLGLSVSFWSGMITGIFPIALTIYLWHREKNERIEQIKEDSKFQKKLIIRTSYIDYFEKLLEQINSFIIFIECFIINDKDLFGRKERNDIRVNNLIGSIYLRNEKVWELNYRVYAFKSIDIDIFKYQYNNEEINLRAYMPYIFLTNGLNKIFNKKNIVGGCLVELNEQEIIEIANDILKNEDISKKLVEFLKILKQDIEERIVFN